MSLLSTPDRRSQDELQRTGVQLLLVKATSKLHEFPDQESITARLDWRFRLLCSDTQYQAVPPMTPTPPSTITADSTSASLGSRANCPDQMRKICMSTPAKQALGKRRRRHATPFSELVDKSCRPVKMLKHGSRIQHRYQPSFCNNRSYTHSAIRILQYQQQTLQENTFSQTSLDHMRDMRRFARHGGPNLEDLRGVRTVSTTVHPFTLLTRFYYTRSNQSPNGTTQYNSSTSCSTRQSSVHKPRRIPLSASARSSGSYGRDFRQRTIEHKVSPLNDGHSNGDIRPRSTGWVRFQRRLLQSRASLAASEFTSRVFGRSVQADVDVIRHVQVLTAVIPIIEPRLRDRCLAGKIFSSNPGPLMDGVTATSNPNLCHGACLETFQTCSTANNRCYSRLQRRSNLSIRILL